MKRILSLLVALMACFSAFAGDGITVTVGKGGLKEIWTTEATAYIEFDWSAATFDNKKTLQEEFGNDYDYVVKDCQDKYVGNFNKKTKGLKLVTDKADGAKYKIVFKVTELDAYFKAMGFIPGNQARVWGEITITSAESGETVGQIKLEKVEAGSDLKRTDCYGKNFLWLGERTLKLK